MSQLMLRVAVAISGRSFVLVHESYVAPPYVQGWHICSVALTTRLCSCVKVLHVRVSFSHFPMEFMCKNHFPRDKNKCSSLKFSRSDGLCTPQTTPVSFVELRLHSGC